MATQVIVRKVCDLDGTVNDEDNSHEVTFSWLDKDYQLDVGQECWETLPMCTIGALVEAAAEVADAPARGSAAARQLAAAPRPARTRGPGELPVTNLGSGKPMTGSGRRRYNFDEYFALWGEIGNGSSQLKCAICGYVTDMAGSDKPAHNKKIARLRSHLADVHDKVMWLMAADARGDEYSAEAAQEATARTS